jgi:cobalamin-dependent methionine synthase I
VEEAVRRRDAEFIQAEARKQAEAGAHMIDANAGTLLSEEVAAMEWLVDTIQAAVDLPISLDSPRPQALEAGLKRVKSKPMVNSITAETARLEATLPLLGIRDCCVVGLTIDDRGMPCDVQQRVDVACRIADAVTGIGMPLSDLYLDPVVQPLGTDPNNGKYLLEAIVKIKKKLPGVHITCGLSNISFGMPNRKLLNRTFLCLAIQAGMDAAILDPCDAKLMGVLRATEALLAIDEWGLEYMAAFRAGRLEV